jgi:hypothetical protein
MVPSASEAVAVSVMFDPGTKVALLTGAVKLTVGAWLAFGVMWKFALVDDRQPRFDGVAAMAETIDGFRGE